MAVYKSDCSRWSNDNQPSIWVSAGWIQGEETIEEIFYEDEDLDLKDQYIHNILSHFDCHGAEKVVCTANGLEGYIYRKRVLIPSVHLSDRFNDFHYRLKDSPRLEKVCD